MRICLRRPTFRGLSREQRAECLAQELLLLGRGGGVRLVAVGCGARLGRVGALRRRGEEAGEVPETTGATTGKEEEKKETYRHFLCQINSQNFSKSSQTLSFSM